MTSKLKALGPAFAAILVLSAVMASGASAQQGTLTSDGPFTLTATETGVGQNWIEAFNLRIECPGSTYTGHKIAVTPHALIPSGTTETTLTPQWKETSNGNPNCKAPGIGITATFDMNGCDFVARIGETTGGGDTYGVKFSVVCSSRQTNRDHTLDRLRCQSNILLVRLAGKPGNRRQSGSYRCACH